MALITCPECGHEVSSTATACINCGHPMEAVAVEAVPVTPASATGAGESGAADAQRSWAMALLLGGLAAVIGSFMPWATVATGFGSISVSGTEGDGVITMIVGGLLVFIGFRARSRGIARRGAIFALVAALVLFGVALYDFIDIRNVASELSTDLARASVGAGLWLVLIGGGAATVASVGLLKRR